MKKQTQLNVFAQSCADLPLFSHTPQRANVAAFNPREIAARQSALPSGLDATPRMTEHRRKRKDINALALDIVRDLIAQGRAMGASAASDTVRYYLTARAPGKTIKTQDIEPGLYHYELIDISDDRWITQGDKSND